MGVNLKRFFRLLAVWWWWGGYNFLGFLRKFWVLNGEFVFELYIFGEVDILVVDGKVRNIFGLGCVNLGLRFVDLDICWILIVEFYDVATVIF